MDLPLITLLIAVGLACCGVMHWIDRRQIERLEDEADLQRWKAQEWKRSAKAWRRRALKKAIASALAERN